MLNELAGAVERSTRGRAKFLVAVLIWQPIIPSPGLGGLKISLHVLAAGVGLFRRRSACSARPKASLDVVDDDLLKVGGNRRATQCHGLLAVDKDRRRRLLAGARQ